MVWIYPEFCFSFSAGLQRLTWRVWNSHLEKKPPTHPQDAFKTSCCYVLSFLLSQGTVSIAFLADRQSLAQQSLYEIALVFLTPIAAVVDVRICLSVASVIQHKVCVGLVNQALNLHSWGPKIGIRIHGLKDTCHNLLRFPLGYMSLS